MAGMRMHQVRSVHSMVGQIIHIGSGPWAGDGEGYGHMTSHLEGVRLLTPAPGPTQLSGEAGAALGTRPASDTVSEWTRADI